MLEIFANPGFLVAGGALISAPIIIHLINRMRFKRLRWAAMEFLLKAQKRNRRRLIIEQLLLLALRCLLVALVGLLVLRFVGFSMADLTRQDNLHIVVLDDTLSTADQWKADEDTKTSHEVGLDLLATMGKNLKNSRAPEKLAVIPISLADDEYEPLIHGADALSAVLESTKSLKTLMTVLKTWSSKTSLKTNAFMQKGMFGALEKFGLPVDLIPDVERETAAFLTTPILHRGPREALKLAQDLAKANKDSQVTLYLISDFRKHDWEMPQAKETYDTLLQMANSRIKIKLLDTVFPYREGGRGGVPTARDNVGIVDFHPSTRVAGKGMPVTFTVALANYSPTEAEVNVIIIEDADGQERFDVDFKPAMPVKLPPHSSNTAVTFELRLNPELRAGEKAHFAQLTAKLESGQRRPLENDGLPHDNVRHTSLEIREKVPILIIDGDGVRGREEGKDSFFIKMAIDSVPGGTYDVIFADDLAGGLPTRVLERPDLSQYPTIFMLNVRELTPKQLAGLENYVREGGGVAFFMGPLVSPVYYNKNLYKGGKGVFPVPLKETYYPAPNEEMLKPEFTGNYHLLLRDDLFPKLADYPIFGKVFEDPVQRVRLMDLPVKRYYQVPRSDWRQEPGKVFELATLPNELPITTYTAAAIDLVRNRLDAIYKDNVEMEKYRKGLDRHRRAIESLIAPTSEKKAYVLAQALDEMLHDKGKDKEREDYPNLTEFWTHSDPKIRTLYDDVVKLRDQVRYGDAFVIAGTFGKGRSVAVMTTAGKDWNDWGGGSDSSLIYQPFIWETQNYLSSQSSEANLTVGTPVQIQIDTEQFQVKDRLLKMVRFYRLTGPGQPAVDIKESEQFGDKKENQLTFSFDNNLEPGLYVSQLHFEDSPEKATPLAAWGHVFNVDTLKESNLQRVAYEDVEQNLIRQAAQGAVRFDGPLGLEDDLSKRHADLSESPWFFLFFLMVLVAEQALAVHLSFHLRGDEAELTGTGHAAAAQPRQAA